MCRHPGKLRFWATSLSPCDAEDQPRVPPLTTCALGPIGRGFSTVLGLLPREEFVKPRSGYVLLGAEPSCSAMTLVYLQALSLSNWMGYKSINDFMVKAGM